MRWLFPRRNGLWVLVIVSLAFNAGFGTTFGVRTYQHYSPDSKHGDGTSLRSLHQRLNLTPEQEAQMEAGRETLFGQVEELRGELSIQTDALADLVTAPEPDRKAIAPQLDKVASLRQEIQQRVVEHFLEVKTLLRPGQREAFDEIIRRHIFRYNGRGHGRMRRAHGFGSGSGSEAERTSNGNEG